jgi:serine protease Do
MVDAFELRNAILRSAVELTRPSVVHIEAQKTRAVSDGRVIDEPVNETNGSLVEEAGSGVIVRYGNSDVVLTNRHVILDAQPEFIRIHLSDGRSVHPRRILSDEATDVAILDIDLPKLVPARVGDSDRLSVGDFVLAFGSPFGLSHSVTQGIVSAKGRRDLIVGEEHVRIQDFIQTDAAINPGNSGGPLTNLRGEVVGINTAIASESGVNAGIGFAMPINIAMFVGKQLVESGAVKTAYLGVKLSSDFVPLDAKSAGVPEFAGAKISKVHAGSPAEEADLRVGDVVFQFNGITVEDDSHLVQLVGLASVGSKVPLVIYRNGKPVTIVVELRGDR